MDRESRGGACSDSREREAISAVAPWCTLGAAANRVLPGDVVHVRGGTYTEIQQCYSCNDNAVLQVVSSGTPTEWIVFQAVPEEQAIISGTGGATHGVQAIETWDNSVQPQYVQISGFQIRDFPGNCVAVKDTSDITLSSLEITGCQGGAVELHNTAQVTVESSQVYANPLSGWTSAIDLYLCRDGNVVRGNFIWGNSDEDPRDSEGHGITMDYCLEAGGALIENNVIWENEGWCMAIYFSDGGIIRNNTCWMNGDPRADTGEISVLGRNHQIFNNILVPRAGRLALNLRERDPEYLGHLDTIQADYNLLWAPTHSDVVAWSLNNRGSVAEYQATNPYGWGVHALGSDPLLSAPASGYFELTGSSPAIDSGDETHAPAVDAASSPRPLDGDGNGTATVDRGAYEYFYFEPVNFRYLPGIFK